MGGTVGLHGLHTSHSHRPMPKTSGSGTNTHKHTNTHTRAHARARTGTHLPDRLQLGCLCRHQLGIWVVVCVCVGETPTTHPPTHTHTQTHIPAHARMRTHLGDLCVDGTRFLGHFGDDLDGFFVRRGLLGVGACVSRVGRVGGSVYSIDPYGERGAQ